MSSLKTVKDRLEAYVDRSGDCWLWTASKTADGYGRTAKADRSGGQDYAHRVSYEFYVGPIPDSYVIDHLCRTPACVNPEHLRAVPMGENTRVGLRGWDLTKMCRRGLHDVTVDSNVKILSSGKRTCRPCMRETDRNRARRAAAARKASKLAD